MSAESQGVPAIVVTGAYGAIVDVGDRGWLIGAVLYRLLAGEEAGRVAGAVGE